MWTVTNTPFEANRHGCGAKQEDHTRVTASGHMMWIQIIIGIAIGIQVSLTG